MVAALQEVFGQLHRAAGLLSAERVPTGRLRSVTGCDLRRSRSSRQMSDASSAEAAAGRKIRVVVAKPGLDGHDRGAKIIARALRDAGMEVIYTGLHQTPEQIAATVIQEDADAVGLSILSGAHMTLVPRVVELLREQGVEDVVVTVGGTIPADDVAGAEEARRRRGVHARAPPTDEIVDFVRSAIDERRTLAAQPS